MKYMYLYEEFKKDNSRVQWLKVNDVESKTDSKIIDELTEMAETQLYDVFYFNPENIEETFKRKLDNDRPILRYAGTNPDAGKFIKTQNIDKSKIYNKLIDMLLSGNKAKWHRMLGDKEYIPKTVFTKEDAIKELKFPVVAKPSMGHSGVGIVKFKNSNDLENDDNTFDIYCQAIDFDSEFRAMFVKDKLVIIYERIPNEEKNKTIDNKEPDEEVQFIYIEQNLNKFPKIYIDQLNTIVKDFRKYISLECYSLDFFIDKMGKVWLIESNAASQLGANSMAVMYEAIYEDYFKKNAPPEKKRIVKQIVDGYRKEVKGKYEKEFKKSKYPV